MLHERFNKYDQDGCRGKNAQLAKMPVMAIANMQDMPLIMNDVQRYQARHATNHEKHGPLNACFHRALMSRCDPGPKTEASQSFL